MTDKRSEEWDGWELAGQQESFLSEASWARRLEGRRHATGKGLVLGTEINMEPCGETAYPLPHS